MKDKKMMNVSIEESDLAPIYYLNDNEDEEGFENEIQAKVDREFFERYLRVMKEFNELQDELGDIYYNKKGVK